VSLAFTDSAPRERRILTVDAAGAFHQALLTEGTLIGPFERVAIDDVVGIAAAGRKVVVVAGSGSPPNNVSTLLELVLADPPVVSLAR
jgi:hypothetical protein